MHALVEIAIHYAAYQKLVLLFKTIYMQLQNKQKFMAMNFNTPVPFVGTACNAETLHFYLDSCVNMFIDTGS